MKSGVPPAPPAAQRCGALSTRRDSSACVAATAEKKMQIVVANKDRINDSSRLAGVAENGATNCSYCLLNTHSFPTKDGICCCRCGLLTSGQKQGSRMCTLLGRNNVWSQCWRGCPGWSEARMKPRDRQCRFDSPSHVQSSPRPPNGPKSQIVTAPVAPENPLGFNSFPRSLSSELSNTIEMIRFGSVLDPTSDNA